ncbi:hypothetical protein DBV15_09312, partial [Temnothorax longispinosus]
MDYDVDAFANQIREQPVSREQQLKDLDAINECVQKVLEQYERIYGSPMPLLEQTKKDTNAFDNTRITYNGNILNNSVFNYTTYQSRPSPSTSTGYNMDLSAERRSEERPDLQVPSSKQTRKRK